MSPPMLLIPPTESPLLLEKTTGCAHVSLLMFKPRHVLGDLFSRQAQANLSLKTDWADNPEPPDAIAGSQVRTLPTHPLARVAGEC